ncbi:hypothetical protein AM587_10015831 [Phytophthora nicotianae]|uniref:FHA domain-containing protein n=1 Tax=Phytophthora nicotianae TaxID=4792 RepID=A0A0W8C8S8_PHYNI|nr:hypothetical protein AM587_10017519 [Phytophthora nicotianae]KUG00431.1 hypothetical protein AM587_10015831 [Phytophthora nicotianae]
MAANQEKENTPEQEQTKPWGRFTFVSKEPAEDSDHIYFRNKVTTIGRNKRRCDIVIDKLFISSVHCVVQLNGTDNTGKPIAKLSDNSRNGIWVNADRVGKGASVTLGNGYTVHFTKPGTTPAGVTPMAYKFEFLNSHSSRPASPKSEANEVPEDINMTVVADESFEATQLDIHADPPSPSEKKRKREDEEPAAVAVATQELERMLKAAESQLMATQSKLKAAEAQTAALSEELEQNVRVKVDKLAQENMNLMSRLEVATVENLKLKTDLAAKDKAMQVNITEAMKKGMEAASNEIQSLKEELSAQDTALAMKIKEAVTKALEADKEKKAQEMTSKLKEATKKYQQKVEAEHFEQRREMSEKMAAYANENEKLQTSLSTKEEELVESEDKIARLRKKVNALEEKTSSLAEQEKKMEEYEEKIAVLKDENSEILGLLAAAEEKATAAENKEAEATIAAAAAKTDATERQELRDAIKSLRSELETYRAQLATRDEEIKKQREAAMTTATATSVSPERIAPDDDAEALRARLAAALNLLGQVQALSRHGVSLITGTNNPDLGDLHLLSAASARTSTAVPDSPSSSPNEDGQQNDEKDPEDSSVKTDKETARKMATKEVPSKDQMEDAVNGAAEPKSSPLKLKREKKKAFKQAAPLSAAIEADAASAIAAMASVNSSAKSSPSEASTAAANGDGEGDWEMLE